MCSWQDSLKIHSSKHTCTQNYNGCYNGCWFEFRGLVSHELSDLDSLAPCGHWCFRKVHLTPQLILLFSCPTVLKLPLEKFSPKPTKNSPRSPWKPELTNMSLGFYQQHRWQSVRSDEVVILVLGTKMAHTHHMENHSRRQVNTDVALVSLLSIKCLIWFDEYEEL